MKKLIKRTLCIALIGTMFFSVSCNETKVAITFDTDGGGAIATQNVVKGESISLPTPTKEGYKFIKWIYADTGLEVNSDDLFEKDTTITAVWELETYSVRYWMFDGVVGSSFLLNEETVACGGAAQFIQELPTGTDFYSYNYSYIDKNTRKKADLTAITSSIEVDVQIYRGMKQTEYVASYAETVPTIDGVIDEAWENATQFSVINEWYPGIGQTKGCAKVMWREDGLYFLGVMENSLEGAESICNFWVCETATDISGDYSKKPADGQYYFSGTETDYKGNFDIPSMQYATKSTNSGWILEAYVPRLSVGEFAENDYIGFDCSIDSDAGNRTRYCNWYGQGFLLVDVAALYKLQLKKD